MILGASDFCTKSFEIWKFIGGIISILKIAVPVILLIWGFIILGKALIASDDKEIKEAWGKLFKRLLIGLIIFFLPGIVSAIVSLVSDPEAAGNDTSVCWQCVVSPNDTTKCHGKVV